MNWSIILDCQRVHCLVWGLLKGLWYIAVILNKVFSVAGFTEELCGFWGNIAALKKTSRVSWQKSADLWERSVGHQFILLCYIQDSSLTLVWNKHQINTINSSKHIKLYEIESEALGLNSVVLENKNYGSHVSGNIWEIHKCDFQAWKFLKMNNILKDHGPFCSRYKSKITFIWLRTIELSVITVKIFVKMNNYFKSHRRVNLSKCGSLEYNIIHSTNNIYILVILNFSAGLQKSSQ